MIYRFDRRPTHLELHFTSASPSFLFNHLEKAEWGCENFSLLHCGHYFFFSYFPYSVLLVASVVFEHYVQFSPPNPCWNIWRQKQTASSLCTIRNFFPAFSYAEPFELHRNLISFRANINSYANFSLKSASCKKGSFVSCLGCCQLPIRIIVCDHYLQETKYSS